MFDNFLADYYENMEVVVREKNFQEFELMIEGILTLFDKSNDILSYYPDN
jgi:hypothetical protein